MNCRTCAGPCPLRGSNIEKDCEWYKPYTNADRLRAMSDEELAEWRVNGQCPPDRYMNDYECNDYNGSCRRCWLGWLRQEAEA